MLRCEHVASHQLAAGLYRRERCEPMTVVSAAVSDVPHAVSVCVLVNTSPRRVASQVQAGVNLTLSCGI